MDLEVADRATLIAEVARLTAALDDAESRHRVVHEDLLVRVELLESQASTLELMVEAYTDLYEHAPVPYLALDASGLIRDLNLTATTMLQTPRTSLIGQPLRLHVVQADRRVFLDHMLQARQSSRLVACEVHLQVGGAQLPVQLMTRRAAVDPADGLLFRTVVIDLGERRRAEGALSASHQRLELALAASEAGLYETSGPVGERTVSERWAQILGYAREALPTGFALGRWWTAQIDPDHLAAHDRALAAFLAGETTTLAVELRVRHASGRWLWVRELAQVAERDPSGRARRVVGVMVDVTVEKTRLAEARERTGQLQALAAALFRVEENERRELATLLHDDLGQRLVAVKLQLAALDREALRSVQALLDETHTTVRSLAFQLSPPILRDLGLLAGLRWLAREFMARYGLAVAVEDPGELPPLAGDPSFLLFRCVRELLLNTVKHAQASAAQVRVTLTDADTVDIVVEDDGVGFDLRAGLGPSRSFGLLSVRERLGWLGGEMIVHSAPGQGARVHLVVPRASRVAVQADDGEDRGVAGQGA